MVLKTGVGLVDVHSRMERKGRKEKEGEGLADVERSKQDGSGD